MLRRMRRWTDLCDVCQQASLAGMPRSMVYGMKRQAQRQAKVYGFYPAAHYARLMYADWLRVESVHG